MKRLKFGCKFPSKWLSFQSQSTRNQKSGHVKWYEVGKGLWELVMRPDPETGQEITKDRFAELVAPEEPPESA